MREKTKRSACAFRNSKVLSGLAAAHVETPQRASGGFQRKAEPAWLRAWGQEASAVTTDEQEPLWPQGRSRDTEAKETVGGGQGAGVGTWSPGVKCLTGPGRFQSQSEDSGSQDNTEKTL